MAGKNKSNTIITVIIIILLFIILIGVMGVIGFMYVDNTENDILNQSYEDNNEMVVQDNKEVVSSGIDWSVLDVRPVHYVNAKRYSYRILVPLGVTSEELKLVGNEVIEYAKRENPFNAITMYFYDSPLIYETFGDTPLCGIDFAPFGKWDEANSVKTAQYDLMEPYYFLKEKDWSQRPSEEEIELAANVAHIIYNQDEEFYMTAMKMDVDTEQFAIEHVSNETGRPFEEIDNIYRKVSSWIRQDLNS